MDFTSLILANFCLSAVCGAVAFSSALKVLGCSGWRCRSVKWVFAILAITQMALAWSVLLYSFSLDDLVTTTVIDITLCILTCLTRLHLLSRVLKYEGDNLQAVNT